MAANDELLKAAQMGLDVFDNITNTPNTPNTQGTKGTRTSKPGYYRFNLNMPLEYEQYLKLAAYNASTPGNVVTITAYINELIRQDMERTKEKAAKNEGVDNGKD